MSRKSKFDAEMSLIEKISAINGRIEKAAFAIVPMGHLSGHIHETRPLVSAVVKNQYLHESAILLVKNGYYGSSNQLLRSAIEANIIGKYICLSGDPKASEQWLSGEGGSIINAIINKISSCPFSEFRAYWRMLHKFTHATVYSQQVTAGDEDDVRGAMTLLLMSVLIQHHINSQVYMTKRARYYLEKYQGVHFPLAEIRSAINAAKASFSSVGKRVYREICHRWEFKVVESRGIDGCHNSNDRALKPPTGAT